MVKIKFGPAGIGHVRDVEETFAEYCGRGIKSAEIPFTYGVFIKDKKQAENIGKIAKKFDIQLSIHAPYWINLNSAEKEKIEASKKRILASAEVGNWISFGRKVNIVFHSGFYGKMDKEETFQNIKKEVLELSGAVKEKKFNVVLCPEVMGKKNVFGSVGEISRLVDETGCGFCIDFAHTLARYGEYPFERIEKSFPQKHWHCHFSGIEYTEKSGEKKHIKTKKEDWKKVLDFLKRLDKEIVIINESNDPVKDSVEGIEIWKG